MDVLISARWKNLCNKLQELFDSDLPDLKVVLFLIGLQELGKVAEKFTRRQKEEIIHVAICKLLSRDGYYSFEYRDEDGWPHWKKEKTVEAMGIFEEEHYLKELCIGYFEEQGLFTDNE